MIVSAPAGWLPVNPNPFRADGLYGADWSALVLDERVAHVSNRWEGARLYVLRVQPSAADAGERTADFLRYETAHGPNVIISGLSTAEIPAVNTEEKPALRPDDPPFFVHSTTPELYQSIVVCGALLAPTELSARGIVVPEIGLAPMREPKDYSEYVMLDVPNGCSELVVHSRRLGRVCPDPDAEYEPGVRMYFDAKAIFRSGLAERDGLHPLKVRAMLPLAPYLLFAVTPETLGPRRRYTPSSFTEAANQYAYAMCARTRNGQE